MFRLTGCVWFPEGCGVSMKGFPVPSQFKFHSLPSARMNLDRNIWDYRGNETPGKRVIFYF